MSHRYRHGMNWIRQEKRLAIYMRDNFMCLYCCATLKTEGTILTLDHVQHRGGNHESNLVTACMDCNVGKGCWSLTHFLRHRADAKKVLRRIMGAMSKKVSDYLPEAKRIRAARNNPF